MPQLTVSEFKALPINRVPHALLLATGTVVGVPSLIWAFLYIVSGQPGAALPFFAALLLSAGAAGYPGWSFFQDKQWNRTRVTIEEVVVRRGDTFHFHFQQSFRPGTSVDEIEVSFLARALVLLPRQKIYNEPPSYQAFDHVIETCTFASSLSSATATISGTCQFQVPVKDLGLRNAYQHLHPAKVDMTWIIQIRTPHQNHTVNWKEIVLTLDS